jgi:serine/threonine protein kinase/tetratricopeptide (TPR) repeat protein
MAISVGRHLGPYEILAPLGAGGMGEVYRARDTKLDRDVAVKVLPQSLGADPDALARFEREAKAVAALSHPNVLSIFDFGTDEGVPYAVMELLEGETLRDKLDSGPIPQRQAVDYAVQVARGLSAAHEKGIIHRDLKPENLFVTKDSHIKILDFGLAKRVEETVTGEETSAPTESGRTEPGTVMGTLSYMSPEQVRGLPVDHRSDIFSFGAILYELLSGRKAFKKDTAADTMSAIMRDEPPELLESGPNITPALDHIVRHCLEKDRNNRFQAAKDVAFDLSEQFSTTITTGFQLAPRRIGKKNLLIAGVVVVVLAGTGWLVYRTGRRPNRGVSATPQPQSVLIADFENKTGEPVFDGTLESSFGLAMEGASFVSNYDRAQARKIAAQLQPGSTRLTQALGRLVAVREGVHIVTAGAIEKMADGYEISVHAVDAATGKPIASETLQVAGKEAVLSAVAKLAAAVRQGMGDVTPMSLQLAAAETFTADSLEASHEYAQAQDDQYAGKYDSAAKHYLNALELDPLLGRADAGLGVIYANQGQRDEAEKYYTRALVHIDRMSDREKYRTRGGYYLIVRRDPDKAIEQYGQLVQRYPADTAGISNLALAHFYKRDMARALREGRKAIGIYPNNVPQRNNVGLYAMYAGDFATAVQEQRKVLEMNPRFVLGYVGLALSQLAEGHAQDAIATYEKASAVNQRGASASAAGLADIALCRGRADEAVAILQRGIDADLAGKDTDSAAVKLAALAEGQLMKGDKAAAIAAAERAASLGKGENVLYPAARVCLESGREAKALALAKDLSGRLEADPRAYAELIRGEVELKRGRPREAILLFESAKKIADTWAGRLDLGKAYVEIGAFTEAHDQLEICARRRGEATAMFLDESPTYHVFPPVHYYLARAQEGVKSPAAAESYKAFLAINEDGGNPLVADARRRLGSK